MFESVFAGAGAAPDAQPMTDATAAYGPAPGGDQTQAGLASFLHPATGFGLSFWLGIGGVAALILIYRSLPG